MMTISHCHCITVRAGKAELLETGELGSCKAVLGQIHMQDILHVAISEDPSPMHGSISMNKE